MKRKICLVLKILTVVTSFSGVVLGCVLFARDGYSAWYKRLYYFTSLSNLWLCFSTIYSLIVNYSKSEKVKKQKVVAYVLQYVFTVSIMVTCIVFCALLGPFAKKEYHAWSVNSLLLHVITPVFAIASFLLEERQVRLTFKHVLLSVIPPLIYFVVATVMGALGVDFGRGETYPYFFMDLNSPAGLFGLVYAEPRPYVGAFYWIALCCLVVLGIGLTLSKLNRAQIKKNVQKA